MITYLLSFGFVFKAAKQAVDTLIDYVKSVNPEIQIKEIMPSGFSKVNWLSYII